MKKARLCIPVLIIVCLFLVTACHFPISPAKPAIIFSATRFAIDRGDCAYVFWQVDEGKNVKLNNEVVESVGNRQVCPSETSNYILNYEIGDDAEVSVLTIQVNEVSSAESNPEEVSLEFWSDKATIAEGECTNLHWNTSGGDVWLDGQKVSQSGEKEICPEKSREYHLEIGDEVLSKTIVITVQTSAAQVLDETEPEPIKEQPTDEPTKEPPAEDPTKEPPTKEPLTFTYGPGFDMTSWSISVLNMSFTFSIQAVVPGKEVTLYLNKVVPVTVYLNGTALPKKVFDDGKTLVITIPVGFERGYIELIGDDVYAISSEEIYAFYNNPGFRLVTDLAVTDLYPTVMPVGQIFTRITNRGPTMVSGTNISLTCSAILSPLPGVYAAANPIYVEKFYTVTIAHNETIILDTGIPNDTDSFTYDVTCTVHPMEASYFGYVDGIKTPVFESDDINNTYSESIP